MLSIDCPWCGPRDETEFVCGGEAGVVRPPEPEKASDAEWADYLFFRTNRKGPHSELWCHGGGCMRWFLVERDTVTNAISACRKIGKTRRGDGA